MSEDRAVESDIVLNRAVEEDRSLRSVDTADEAAQDSAGGGWEFAKD